MIGRVSVVGDMCAPRLSWGLAQYWVPIGRWTNATCSIGSSTGRARSAMAMLHQSGDNVIRYTTG